MGSAGDGEEVVWGIGSAGIGCDGNRAVESRRIGGKLCGSVRGGALRDSDDTPVPEPNRMACGWLEGGILLDSGYCPSMVVENLPQDFQAGWINPIVLLILCASVGFLLCFCYQESSLLLANTCLQLGW